MRLASREAKASQNKGQAGHAMGGATHGPPKNLTKTRASKEELAHMVDSPSPSPTPSRTVESSSLPTNATVESEAEEDMKAPRGREGDAPHMPTKIHNTEEGRKYLKEAQLIELEDTIDGEVLASALVQISLFPGMSQAMRDAMCMVAFLLVQVELDGPGDAAAKGIMD